MAVIFTSNIIFVRDFDCAVFERIKMSHFNIFMYMITLSVKIYFQRQHTLYYTLS